MRAAAEHRKPVVLQLGTPSEVERTIKIVGIERVLPRAHEREDAVAMIRQHRDADRAASGAPRMRGGGENAAARSALTYVNTSIFEAAAESIAQEATWDFFCECGDPACNERAALTLNRYEQLRDAGEAILAPGHHVDENARARALRADAQALRAQARHQVRRAGKKLDDPGLRS